MITEVGAVKVRGGEVLGEFQTLVNPHQAIPPFIAVLTGITDSMVAAAPRIEQVLPQFLEFAQGCVLVAHNAPFDVGFLQHFAEQQGRPWPRFEVLDTAKLARRVITRDDAPNCKLSSLAVVFGSDDHAQPPGAVRRPGDRRRAARPDGAARQPRRAHAGGAADLQRARHHRPAAQAAPRRAAAARTRGLPLPGRRAAGCSTSAPAATCAPGSAPTSPPRRPAPGWARWSASRRPCAGIECATPLEAEVRELRLIAAAQAALQPPLPVPRAGALDQADPRAVAAALPGPARSSTTTRTTSAPTPPSARPSGRSPPCTRRSRSASAAAGCRRPRR